MKQRITIQDIAQLNSTQKANLRALWIPVRSQITIASVCVNAETDEYIDIEFSIGKIFVRPNGSLTIKDLRAIDGYRRDDEDEQEFPMPTSFSKDQCLPLLSIGEMIEIMEAYEFRGFHFYLLAGTGVTGCEVGRFRSTLKDKILAEGFQNKELCDVLWEMIVAQL